MSDILSDIEDYFSGKSSERVKEAFENKCISDPVFAEEVALYISMRDALKQQLYEQKKHEFAQIHAELIKKNTTFKSIVARMLPYAAAACLVVLLGWALFFREASLEKEADNYISENFQTLGVAMGSSTDRLQRGIAAYNNNNYEEAARIFRMLSQSGNTDPEVIKNLGIVYLVTGKYDEAMVQFDILAQQKNLFANPALFYKALVLLKRAATEDREAAKQLLKDVSEKNLPGKKEAEAWLPKL